jgi:hypothetical protein
MYKIGIFFPLDPYNQSINQSIKTDSHSKRMLGDWVVIAWGTLQELESANLNSLMTYHTYMYGRMRGRINSAHISKQVERKEYTSPAHKLVVTYDN